MKKTTIICVLGFAAVVLVGLTAAAAGLCLGALVLGIGTVLSVIASFFTGLLLLAWWVLLSRARWWARRCAT